MGEEQAQNLQNGPGATAYEPRRLVLIPEFDRFLFSVKCNFTPRTSISPDQSGRETLQTLRNP